MTTTMEKYRDLMVERGMTPSSIQSYTYDVSRFLRDNILEEVDAENISSLYAKWVQGRKGTVSDSTLHRQMGAIRLYADHIYGVVIVSTPKPKPPPAVKHVPRDVVLPKLASPDWRANDDWRAHAACKNKTHIMFKNTDPGRAEAKAICATCPGAAPCLDFALRNRLDDGVWGGYDSKERQVMLRSK